MTALASDAGRAKGGIVPILLCVVPFSQIPLDAYTPGLPQMVVDLAADAASMQNTVTAYMLGMSLALVPVGIASDTLGRRNVLLAGLSVLIAMSIACALATSASLLLALRFLQGIGGCTCLVVAYAVAADCFRGRELTAISGLLGAAWGLAPVLAPAAGGFIVELTSWRGVFVVIAIAAAIVATIVVFLLPETLPAERRAPFDPRRTGRYLARGTRSSGLPGLRAGLRRCRQRATGVRRRRAVLLPDRPRLFGGHLRPRRARPGWRQSRRRTGLRAFRTLHAGPRDGLRRLRAVSRRRCGPGRNRHDPRSGFHVDHDRRCAGARRLRRAVPDDVRHGARPVRTRPRPDRRPDQRALLSRGERRYGDRGGPA
ncbi:MFS transporter [Bradyrhizobium liaoningense]|uniref:MFS transporter n=1 Tax=Bradyrhizobium liaoningense TaxID=43992 RepID=UPI003221BD02